MITLVICIAYFVYGCAEVALNILEHPTRSRTPRERACAVLRWLVASSIFVVASMYAVEVNHKMNGNADSTAVHYE